MLEEDYLLPDDYTEDTTEVFQVGEQEVEEVEEAEDTADVQQPEESEKEVESEPVDQFEISYKYNHTEGKITDKEEATKLLQLGMMYQDKIVPQLETLKTNNEKFEKFQQIAELYGLDVDGLHNILYDQYIEGKAEEQGVTPEMIRKERELYEKENALNRKEQQELNSAKEKQMFDKFISAYPDVKTQDIKPETWAMVDSGIDLVTAFTMQRNNELTQQLKTKEQNSKNKNSSPAVTTTKYGGDEPNKDIDDFLEGFNS